MGRERIVRDSVLTVLSRRVHRRVTMPAVACLLVVIGAGLLASAAPGGPAALPTLSISDAEGTNFQTATSSMTFTVTLSAASTAPVTVDYATRYDNDDLTPSAGTLRFAPGEVTRSIVIELLPEPGQTDEDDEVMYVDLTNPVNATLAKEVGVGIIHFRGEPTPEQVNVTSAGDRNQCVKTVDTTTCEHLGGEAQFEIADITYINPGTGKIDIRTTDGEFRFSGSAFDLDKVDATSSGTGKAGTVITLRGGSYAACKTSHTTVGSRSTSGGVGKKPPKSVRRLWGKGKGSFRTRGRYSSGTVRGTYWLTVDRCDGTRTYVREGVVAVFDLVKKKTVKVSAGHSYLASPNT
jgi:hypothetical protein